MDSLKEEQKLRKTIGLNLKMIMFTKRVTQMDLSDRLGITQTQISRWVNGKHLPGTKTIVDLSKFFGVPTDYWFQDRHKAG